MKPEFFKRLYKYPDISNFMKIHPVGAQFFSMHAVRHDEANSQVLQFCKHTYKQNFCVGLLQMNWFRNIFTLIPGGYNMN